MMAALYKLCWTSIEMKLYLPRQKWTKNEMLIFFKIRDVFKKYRDWNCFYQDRNEQRMKCWFSSKYEMCWKSIGNETVFTKKKINNEWNVDFLQHTRCVEKVSRLKLYLPRQKWTKNETLIFFKTRDVLKKNRDWSCIYQDRNEQTMKCWFSSKYEMCSKSIKTEAVFTKTEINNEWIKRWFSSTYMMCWKSIGTEAVFIKTEMNKEWNVDFLQHTKCVEKVSGLKLYLPRQKWTKNETLIFFNIRDVLKKYRDWICIYQDRNEQRMKCWFSSTYEMCWKSIGNETVFTKTEINNEWMKRWFSSTYEMCGKSIKIEAVFTKTENNNEWNVDFLQHTRCVEKVSGLNLYLPRQKWTKNEMLIFFNIRDVLKKYREWNCFYQDRNQQWMKRWFSSTYEMCWKSIGTEADFTKT